MSNQKFSVYPGKWPCKTCDEVVTSLRLWQETGTVSWMCSKKHISKVDLIPNKKRKRDYLNEK
jgi:hypothetical protein